MQSTFPETPMLSQPDANAPGHPLLSAIMVIAAGRRVVGFRIGWQSLPPSADGSGPPPMPLLLEQLGRHFAPPLRGWRLGRTTLFVDLCGQPLPETLPEGLPPQQLVLCMAASQLLGAGATERSILAALRQQGCGLMLWGSAVPGDGALRRLLTHVDVLGGGPEAMLALRREAAAAGRHALQPVVTRLEKASDFDECALPRIPVMLKGASPQQIGPHRGLQPGALCPHKHVRQR